MKLSEVFDVLDGASNAPSSAAFGMIVGGLIERLRGQIDDETDLWRRERARIREEVLHELLQQVAEEKRQLKEEVRCATLREVLTMFEPATAGSTAGLQHLNEWLQRMAVQYQQLDAARVGKQRALEALEDSRREVQGLKGIVKRLEGADVNLLIAAIQRLFERLMLRAPQYYMFKSEDLVMELIEQLDQILQQRETSTGVTE